MKKMRKLYLVHGIHDGTLAICSNIKRAYEITEDYNSHNNDEKEYERMTYSQTTKAFKNGRAITYHGDATIELRYLNSY